MVRSLEHKLEQHTLLWLRLIDFARLSRGVSHLTPLWRCWLTPRGGNNAKNKRGWDWDHFQKARVLRFLRELQAVVPRMYLSIDVTPQMSPEFNPSMGVALMDVPPPPPRVFPLMTLSPSWVSPNGCCESDPFASLEMLTFYPHG